MRSARPPRGYVPRCEAVVAEIVDRRRRRPARPHRPRCGRSGPRRDAFGPGGCDTDEPAESALGERHDPRGARVARRRRECAVEVCDNKEPPGPRRESERDGACPADDPVTGRRAHGVATSLTDRASVPMTRRSAPGGVKADVDARGRSAEPDSRHANPAGPAAIQPRTARSGCLRRASAFAATAAFAESAAADVDGEADDAPDARGEAGRRRRGRRSRRSGRRRNRRARRSRLRGGTGSGANADDPAEDERRDGDADEQAGNDRQA